MGQTVINDLVSFQKKYGKPVGIGIIGPGAVPKQIEERIEIHAHNATFIKIMQNPLTILQIH